MMILYVFMKNTCFSCKIEKIHESGLRHPLSEAEAPTLGSNIPLTEVPRRGNLGNIIPYSISFEPGGYNFSSDLGCTTRFVWLKFLKTILSYSFWNEKRGLWLEEEKNVWYFDVFDVHLTDHGRFLVPCVFLEGRTFLPRQHGRWLIAQGLQMDYEYSSPVTCLTRCQLWLHASTHQGPGAQWKVAGGANHETESPCIL